ncbi:MAG: cytochrome P450 [Solirubrobacterales bacterium]
MLREDTARTTLAPPPGPRSPAPVQLAQRFLTTTRFAERCVERYGHIYMLRMPGGERVVQVSDPDAIKQIFTAPKGTFDVGSGGNALLMPLVGSDSLLTLDGDRHLHHRRLLLPPLHGERMRGYRDLMVEVTENAMASWPVDRPFAIHPQMRDITLDVIIRAVFGVKEATRQDELRQALREILDLGQGTIAFAPWIRHWVHRPWVKFLELRERVDELLYQEIARRRGEPDLAEREDILSLLLQAHYEDGSPMSDKELRDELVTMLVAGHETTATGLAWTFDLILHDERVMERLLGSLDEGDEYLDAVIAEALRIRPVIAQISRKPREAFELGGYTIPSGALVAPNIALVHRRGDLYPEPNAFKPERFLDDGPDTYTWLPFGGGVRRCAGAAFATFEMGIVLRTVLQRAKLRAADPEPEQPHPRAVTIAPRNGTTVVAERIDLR